MNTSKEEKGNGCILEAMALYGDPKGLPSVPPETLLGTHAERGVSYGVVHVVSDDTVTFFIQTYRRKNEHNYITART